MSLLKKTSQFCPAECQTFLDLLRNTRSKESQIAASLYFRKKLAACQEPPSEVVEKIILELLDCLRRTPSSTELQLNASWTLTNLACGSKQETHRIIASGGAEALFRLASTSAGEVRDQTIWALGNLAADCSVCRERVRATGLLTLLMDLSDTADFQAHDARKILTWCLANLLRGGINDIDLDAVNKLLCSLHATITVYNQGEILCDAVWCIAYLIDHATVEGERIDLLFAQPGLVGSIVALLNSDVVRALTGALRTVGNIITGTDEQTTAILDFGVLDNLNLLVKSEVHQISRECLWILSNIAAGTPEHVTRLFSVQGLGESVFRACQDQSQRKRKEAYWVLVNALMGAPAPLFDHLLSGGLAQIVVQLLAENLDRALLDRTLNTIRHSLQDRPQSKQYTTTLFRRVGLVAQLLRIARSAAQNEVASELARTILAQHFGIQVIDKQQQQQGSPSSTATHSTEGSNDNNNGSSAGQQQQHLRERSILVRIKRDV